MLHKNTSDCNCDFFFLDTVYILRYVEYSSCVNIFIIIFLQKVIAIFALKFFSSFLSNVSFVDVVSADRRGKITF